MEQVMGALAAPDEVAPPALAEVGGALAALAGLALCAALPGGLRDPVAWVAWAPAVWVGTAALGAPPMLVATELLHLGWTGRDVLEALVAGLVRSGRLAAAVVPTALLFVATSDVGGPLSIALLVGVALPGLATTHARLAARGRPADGLALLIWLPLLAAIGGRLLAQPFIGRW